jgi:hypothetical protein
METYASKLKAQSNINNLEAEFYKIVDYIRNIGIVRRTTKDSNNNLYKIDFEYLYNGSVQAFNITFNIYTLTSTIQCENLEHKMIIKNKNDIESNIIELFKLKQDAHRCQFDAVMAKLMSYHIKL